MSWTLAEILPYVLSVGTLSVNWLAGSKWRYTYAVALINQAVWFFWIFWTHNYGFIILNTFLTFIYIRNHIRWTRDHRTIAMHQPERHCVAEGDMYCNHGEPCSVTEVLERGD